MAVKFQHRFVPLTPSDYPSICYWLLVIGYWLLVIGYWLLVIGYLLIFFSLPFGELELEAALPTMCDQAESRQSPIITSN